MDRPHLLRLLNYTSYSDLSLDPQTNVPREPLSSDLPLDPNFNIRGPCTCKSSIALIPEVKQGELKNNSKPLPRHLVHSARRRSIEESPQTTSQHNEVDTRPGEKTRHFHFDSCDCIVSD